MHFRHPDRGPTFFFRGADASTYRADITNLGLVGDGSTTLSLSGMGYTDANNGAGVMVIYDDGTGDAGIDLFFASVSGSASGGTVRPTAIEVTVTDGSTSSTEVFDNLFNPDQGSRWRAVAS